MRRQKQSFPKSVGHAWHGIAFGIERERHFRFELIVAIVAVVLAVAMGLSEWEIALIIGVSGLVLGLELLNTAVEMLADVVNSRYSGKIKIVKDVAAAAVLVATLAAIAIGFLLFGPVLFKALG